jgi:flavin-dependent dehydrogenase
VHAFQGIVEIDLPEDSMWAVFESGITPYYGWLVPKGEGQFLLGAGFPQGADATRREAVGQTLLSASERNGRQVCLPHQIDPWAKINYLVGYIEQLGHRVRVVDDKPEGCPITTITTTDQLWWGKGRLFPVGEAAGMVSPSSGDGIHFGLEHASALADELVSAGAFNGASADLHQRVTGTVRKRLRASITELRFNCLKSKVASKPFSRGIAARLLPLYLRRPV